MIQTLREKYFNWLYDMMYKDRFSEGISYKKMFKQLHDRDFIWSIKNDDNRASDGIDLRYRFSMLYFDDNEVKHAVKVLHGPCTVLEMLCGLAIRCEESLMDDTRYGDRTSQWFWNMITSMGIQTERDNDYDHEKVAKAIDNVLFRTYQPNGVGGLFVIPGCKEDLTKVEFWTQMNWYIDRLV